MGQSYNIWSSGSTPGPISHHYLVAIQTESGIDYDLLYWKGSRRGQGKWRDTISGGEITATAPLALSLEFCLECDKSLTWSKGETPDQNQRYVVALANQYSMNAWLETEDGNYWSEPNQKEVKYGYTEYISLKDFISSVRQNLPFNKE